MPDGAYLTAIKQTNKRQARTASRSPATASRPSCATSTPPSGWRTRSCRWSRASKDNAVGSDFTLYADQATTLTDDEARAAKTAARPRSRRGPSHEPLDELKISGSARSGPLAAARARWAPRRLVFVVFAALRLFLRVERTSGRSSTAARPKSRSCAASSRTSSKAVNLELYKQQLADIERSFGAMLRQLPGKTEVPNLLVDISQTGLAAGLQEKLFQPATSRAATSTRSCRSRSGWPAATTSSATSSAASRRCRASSRCTTSRSSRSRQGRPTTSCSWT